MWQKPNLVNSYLEAHASLFYLALYFPVTAPISNVGKQRDNYFLCEMKIYLYFGTKRMLYCQ